MSKKILIFAICLLIVPVMLWGCTPKQNASELMPVGGRPNYGDKLNLSVPTDEAELKQFAYHLYMTANANYQNLESAAYAVKSVTTTMGYPVIGYRYVVKNDDQYVYTEYSFVEEEGANLILGLFAKDSTQFAMRRYTDDTMEGMYEEKTLSPTYTVADGENVYRANWNKLYYAKTVDKPVYYADQEETFEYTDQKITAETIKEISLEYHEEEGFYRMMIELDLENPLTTSITLPNLRANAGSSDAHYTGMTQTIDIWDNGYFKYFLAEDHWEGRLDSFPIDLVSDIHFETQFIYNEEYLDFNYYQYAGALVEKCAGEQPVLIEAEPQTDASLYVYIALGMFGLSIVVASVISVRLAKKNRKASS